ncbi:hypothetical protein [Priestia flexa]|uniref:hypothetical protein n=1 Tax=Priestia flexa TaxID=86664 RepID=UPI00249158E7|nr:hypothetical protein [Priestia flexa]
MGKKNGKGRERKTRMGIVTNKMSDEVYEQLDSKALANELSKYLIQLVERDLEGEAIRDAFELAKDELIVISKVATELKYNLEMLMKEHRQSHLN